MTKGMTAVTLGLAILGVAVSGPRVVRAQQATPPPRTPAPAQPTPVQPDPRQAGQTTAATTPVVPRTFSAPVGLLFNTVRPERVEDFEKVIAYLQAAFAKTTDPVIRKQASGWRVFKATELGPNSTIVYVFVLDPTVPGAEYGLGRILADAYPDTTELQEIWRLYTSSVTSGGTLMNLSPVSPDPSILTQPARSAPKTDPATTKTPPAGQVPAKPQSPPGAEPR